MLVQALECLAVAGAQVLLRLAWGLPGLLPLLLLPQWLSVGAGSQKAHQQLAGLVLQPG